MGNGVPIGLMKKHIRIAKDGMKDPQGKQKENTRLLRGSCFADNHTSARCAFRFRSYPNYSNSGHGFRIASSAIKLESSD